MTSIKRSDSQDAVNLAPEGNQDRSGCLIDHCLDIEDTDTPSQIVLHLVCQLPRVEIFRLLLDIGADINKTSGWGLAALHFAVEVGV